jgi:hypothetical protein
MANYKETQLTRVKPGQPVNITVDSFPNEKLDGRVDRISPASDSQFAQLPPDNATCALREIFPLGHNRAGNTEGEGSDIRFPPICAPGFPLGHMARESNN